MRKGVFAVALIACLLAVSPAVAAVIVDEKLNDWTDTGGSGGYSCSETRPQTAEINSLTFTDITKFQTLNYVVVDIPCDCGQTEGRNLITYTYAGQTKDAAMDIVKSRNILGQVTNTHITVFFYDWNIGSKTGSQVVTLSKPFRVVSVRAYNGVSYTGNSALRVSSDNGANPGTPYKITWSSGVVWTNFLKISEIYGDSYEIALSRNISGNFYSSTISLKNPDGAEFYTSTKSIDETLLYRKSQVGTVTISSASKSYPYTLSSKDPETPTESEKFALSLSPETGSVGSPITATLTPAADAPRYSEIAWTVSDPDGNRDIELYTKSSDDWTTWTHYNKTSRRLDPSSEGAAHSLQFTPTGAGTWTISAVVRDQQPPSSGAALAEVSATCEVERKAGNVDVIISVFDGAKSSASYLAGVGVVVRDLTRDTVIYDSTGEYIPGASGTTNGRVTFSAPLGDQIQITAKKTGYLTAATTYFVQPTALPLNQMPIAITLMPAATPAPDKAYLTVLVTDLRSQPIEGASVLVAGSGGVTGSQGTCRITVPTNQTLSYTVSAQGYHSVSGYVMDGITENTQITVELISSAAPTLRPTTPPGGGPVVTPDYRSIDEKATSALSILFDHVELFAALAGLVLLCNMLFWIVPGGKR